MDVPRRKRRKPTKSYSIGAIADFYGFHRNTVRAWVHRDGLRHFRRGNKGDIYIREDDLKEFLREYYDLIV